MGKASYKYTDSESEETTTTTSESEVVKKKRFSNNILPNQGLESEVIKNFAFKYLLNYTRKFKKNKSYMSAEPESSAYTKYTNKNRTPKLRGILKDNQETESSEDETVYMPVCPHLQAKCLVGRVPGPSGETAGEGSGFAIIIRKSFKSNASRRIDKHNASKQQKFLQRLSF